MHRNSKNPSDLNKKSNACWASTRNPSTWSVFVIRFVGCVTEERAPEAPCFIALVCIRRGSVTDHVRRGRAVSVRYRPSLRRRRMLRSRVDWMPYVGHALLFQFMMARVPLLQRALVKTQIVQHDERLGHRFELKNRPSLKSAHNGNSDALYVPWFTTVISALIVALIRGAFVIHSGDWRCSAER